MKNLAKNRNIPFPSSFQQQILKQFAVALNFKTNNKNNENSINDLLLKYKAHHDDL